MKRIFVLAILGGTLVVGRAEVSATQDRQEEGLAPNLPGVNLHDLTVMVQKMTGKKFLWTEELGLRNKRVNFISSERIKNKEDIFRVYQHFLQVNDLILVPAKGKDDKETVYKITLASTGPKRPVEFESKDVKPMDRFVSRLFHLRHIDPQDVQRALINMATYPQGLLSIESAGILLITDYDYNIQRFERIIKEMDQPKPDIVLRRIVLKNANAKDVQEMMNTLGEVILARRSGGAGLPIRGRSPIPGRGSQGSEQLKIVADTRTNSVIVLADHNRIQQIEDVIRELDSETGFETSGIYIHHLRHTNALDIARTLNAMYKISVDDKGVPSGGSGVRPGETVGPRTGGTTPTRPSAPTTSSGTTALTGAEPTIVADVRSNSIIMITDRNTYRALQTIIKRLDSRRSQVLLHATVVEVRSTDSFDFGVELARLVDPKDRIVGIGATSFGNSTILPDTANNEFTVTPTSTTGLTLALLKDKIGNIGALLRTVEEKAKVTILDEPEVATVDNGNAEVKVSDQVPILETTVTGTGIAQTTFNRFETAETVLSISPHISEGGYLRLDMEIKIEKFTSESADPTIPPPKTSRSIKTNSILVPNGRTVVIGGIVTRDDSDTTTGVPILSHIPILGLFFRKNVQKQQKRTLYIFITPHILYDARMGDYRKLTGERKRELERLRRQVLERFQIDGPAELRMISTFRFTGPIDR